MALNLNTIVPASLKAKEVATVDYVDTTATSVDADCLFCGGGAGGTPIVDGTNNGSGTGWAMYGGTSYGDTNGLGVAPTGYSTGSGY